MSAAGKPPPIARDWTARTLAGLLLGFGLALGCSGVLAQLLAALPLALRGQLAMWLVVPLWFVAFGASGFFTSGLRAWLWLGGANLLAWGAWGALRLAQN
ncbi:hypothetical protein [Derxia gummosa]|uniref:Uncharacterized protein n=1 Tax=Derxia gummosa DSM 723 TaxID=1121388 RepID=A0A8B6X4C1_9BURK|nr:hypothetical protein [Derxia gummosa]